MLKSGVSLDQIGELTFPQIRLFVKYYFEERGEWLKIVNNYLGGGDEKSKGTEASRPTQHGTQIERERPGQHIHVIESDNPIPDGMGFEPMDESDIGEIPNPDGSVVELN